MGKDNFCYEIYFPIEEANDPSIDDLPYLQKEKNQKRLFIGCSTDEDYSTERRLFRNRSHSLEKDGKFSFQTRYCNYKEPLNKNFVAEALQELTQYKDRQVHLRFYLEPHFFSKEESILCENSRMMGYEVLR